MRIVQRIVIAVMLLSLPLMDLPFILCHLLSLYYSPFQHRRVCIPRFRLLSPVILFFFSVCIVIYETRRVGGKNDNAEK